MLGTMPSLTCLFLFVLYPSGSSTSFSTQPSTPKEKVTQRTSPWMEIIFSLLPLHSMNTFLLPLYLVLLLFRQAFYFPYENHELFGDITTCDSSVHPQGCRAHSLCTVGNQRLSSTHTLRISLVQSPSLPLSSFVTLVSD